MNKPINKSTLFNTALPGAGSNILNSDISPQFSPGTLRIYVCISIAGVLSIARTSGGSTITENLNAGSSLVACAAYIFSVPWTIGETINLRCSTTGGIIYKLQIDEGWD